MKTLFDSVSLGNLNLKNRLIRSATLEIGCAKDGKITPLLGQVYQELAIGDIGLIITGMMGVAPNSCLSLGMTKIYDDSFAESFSKITKDVHQNGSKIVVQLGHCGARSFELDGDNYPYAPSDVELPNSKKAKAMTIEQIDNLVKAYGAAALKCKENGADGVQIHGAHGYLISQFLSPIFNKRTDEYGGDIKGRSKLLFEIYDEIKNQAGKDYPVLIKINYSDIADGGISESDVLWYCKELDKRSIAAIEVSAGIGMNSESSAIQAGRVDEAFNVEYALILADKVDTPIISVGGYRSLEKINDVLNRGKIEAISLCRPLIREPGLIKRWQDGDLTNSTCISCGKCFMSKIHGCFLDNN